MQVRNIGTGAVVEIATRLVIGREESCDIVLDDEKVSRRHCALTPQPDGRVVIEDLGSSNGTFVNRERISGPVTLIGGEEVRVGSTVMSAEGEPTTTPTIISDSQRTVVGAPSAPPAPPTQPPAQPPGPPPGPPPAPPSGEPPPGGRPWWRSKWALIGAVAALAVIGGAVGGVLAATGGGDDDAAATTSEPQEPETVTVAQSVETETASETETAPETDTATETGAAAETGAVAGTFPNDLEAALLDHVPTDQNIAASCERADLPADTDAVASVGCEASDGTELLYYQFASLEGMNAWYDDLVASSGATRDAGDCAADERAEGTWSIGSDGATAGRVFCTPSTDGANRFIFWTSDGLMIGSAAGAEGNTTEVSKALYDLWSAALGPL
jgi:hypothetical protein